LARNNDNTEQIAADCGYSELALKRSNYACWSSTMIMLKIAHLMLNNNHSLPSIQETLIY